MHANNRQNDNIRLNDSQILKRSYMNLIRGERLCNQHSPVLVSKDAPKKTVIKGKMPSTPLKLTSATISEQIGLQSYQRSRSTRKRRTGSTSGVISNYQIISSNKNEHRPDQSFMVKFKDLNSSKI